MIKKEWSWMLDISKKDNKVGLKSYMCNANDKHDDDEQYLEDGVDDFIGRPKKDTYNDDDYDY